MNLLAHQCVERPEYSIGIAPYSGLWGRRKIRYPLGFGALLHDLGKLGTDDNILRSHWPADSRGIRNTSRNMHPLPANILKQDGPSWVK